MVVKVSLSKLTFGFHHDEPKLFVQSQWQSGEKSVIFLVYRWILSLFFISVLAYNWTDNLTNDDRSFAKTFIYLTNWGVIFCVVTTTYATILTSFHHFGVSKLESHHLSYKVYWFLSNVTIVNAFVISVVYWSVLFEGRTSTLDVLVHGSNSLGMFIDLCVAAHPMYWLHFLHTIYVGLTYLIFTIIYYYAGGLSDTGEIYIYHVIDWSQPGSAAVGAVAVAALGILLHVFACVVQRVRHILHKKFFDKTVLNITNPQNATA